MKKIFPLVLTLLFLSLAISSCSKSAKNSEVSSHDAFIATLTTEDTTEVLNLCQDFFTKLASGDKEAAINMLSLSNDSCQIIPMTEEKKQSLIKQFTIFPVLDNHLVDYTFGDAADNLMRFKVVFAKDEQGKEDAINFGLNPIRKDGKWYLTVRNASAQVAQ